MTDNRVVLSVIIAAYNSESTLSATLENLLDACNGSLDNIEVILVNDNSSDRTAQIMQEFSASYQQMKYFRVDYHNIGQVRQFAIDNSTGDYITMLDSDDLMKQNSLQEIIVFLNEIQPDMVLTRLNEIRDVSKISYQWQGFQPEKISQDQAITKFLIHKDLQAHLIGQFIKRDIYLVQKIPAMKCYEDFYVFPTMLTHAQKIYFQSASHYYYIKRQNSLSSVIDNEKVNNLIICTLKMQEIFPAKFKQLILCHWLDIYIKHRAKLNDSSQLNIVNNHVLMTHTPSFFLNLTVRLSYKRKALSTLWKK